MGFAFIGSIFPNTGTTNTAGNGTAGASTSFTTTASASAGTLLVIAVAKDNVTTAANGSETNEVTGVSDSAGNTYFTCREYAYGGGAAAAGQVAALWYSVLSSTLPSGGTVSLTFSASISAKSIQGLNYSLDANNDVIPLDGDIGFAAGVAPGSLSVSGLTSREYLFVRVVGSEGVSGGTDMTATAGWTTTGHGRSGTGAGASSCQCEYRIQTTTSATSNPTGITADSASVLIAFRQVPYDAGGKTYFVDCGMTGGAGHAFARMTETATTAISTSSISSGSGAGWQVGTNGAGMYSPFDTNTIQTRSSFTSTVVPDGTLDGASGDGWGTTATLSGQFAAGTWTFLIPLTWSKSATTTGSMRINLRVFKSANADGTSATELTSTTLTTNTITESGTWTVREAVVTWSPGSVFLFSNEYLFVQVGAETVTAADNSTFEVDPNGYTRVYTPAFSTAVSVTLTGQSMTSAQGSVAPTTAPGLTGQAAAASQGSLVAALTSGLTGQAVTASLGSITALVSKAITGQAVIASQGTVTAIGGNVVIVLAGQAITAGQGSVAPTVSKALAGAAMAAGQGVVAVALSKALSGLGLTAAQGFVAVSTSKGLTGQALTLTQGTLVAAVSKALTGQAVVAAQGSVTTQTVQPYLAHQGFIPFA